MIPCLATSIIPDDITAPIATPADATINTVRNLATLAPIALFKKFTASLLTPTKRSNIARHSKNATITRYIVSILLFIV